MILQLRHSPHRTQAHRKQPPLRLSATTLRLNGHHHVRSEWHRRGSEMPYRQRVDSWGPVLLLGLFVSLVGFCALIAYASYLLIRMLFGGA